MVAIGRAWAVASRRGRGRRAGRTVRADCPAPDREAAPPAGRCGRPRARSWWRRAHGPDQWAVPPDRVRRVRELDDPPDPRGRIRRLGGGPKRLVERNPGPRRAVDEPVD